MSVKHDWYQSIDKVVITILLKKAEEKNCKINITVNRVLVTTDDNYTFDCNLFDSINAEKSTYKISPIKIEITLYKLNGNHWTNLMKRENNDKLSEGNGNNSGTVAAAPVSNSIDKWEKVAKAIDKDDEEAKGDDALNDLFKKIYSTSSEEVRRAMNKSFSESQGTVLSTNWTEVGSQQVDVRPPDGVEYKKWE